MMEERVGRRRFLAALSAGVVGSAGGCLELQSPGEATAADTGGQTPATTRERATSTGTPTASTESTGADWPSHRRGPRNSASVPEAAGPQSKPTVLGRLETDEARLDSAAVVDGTVYAADDNGGVRAFDAASGRQRWHTSGTDTIFRTPAVANGTVVVGAGNAGVRALDAETGTERWSWSVGERVTSSPTIADGVVYAGRETVAALSLDSGQVQWRHQFERATGTPAVSGRTVVVPTGEGALVGFDRTTGRRQFRYTTVARVLRRVAIVARSAYVAASDGRLHAVHLDTGKQRWAATVIELSEGRNALPYWPTDAGETLVTGGGIERDDVTFVGLDMADGSTRWTWSPDAIASAPVVAGSTVYVNLQGRLTARSAADGSERWTTEQRRIPPELSLAGGRLYAAGGSIQVLGTE